MRTGNTECIGCNQPYLNCYQTCPRSPARGDRVLVNTVFSVSKKGGAHEEQRKFWNTDFLRDPGICARVSQDL